MMPCLYASLAPVNPFCFGKEWGQDEFSQSWQQPSPAPAVSGKGAGAVSPSALAVSHSRLEGLCVLSSGTVSLFFLF